MSYSFYPTTTKCTSVSTQSSSVLFVAVCILVTVATTYIVANSVQDQQQKTSHSWKSKNDSHNSNKKLYDTIITDDDDTAAAKQDSNDDERVDDDDDNINEYDNNNGDIHNENKNTINYKELNGETLHTSCQSATISAVAPCTNADSDIRERQKKQIPSAGEVTKKGMEVRDVNHTTTNGGNGPTITTTRRCSSSSSRSSDKRNKKSKIKSTTVTTTTIITNQLENNHNNRKEELSLQMPILLPSHMEREIMKEERRRLMLPLLTMKKPMYDNVFLLDPQNNVLSTMSLKKARWYIRKDLAEWIIKPPPVGIEQKEEQQPIIGTGSMIPTTTTLDNKQCPTIRLKFQPNNNNSSRSRANANHLNLNPNPNNNLTDVPCNNNDSMISSLTSSCDDNVVVSGGNNSNEKNPDSRSEQQQQQQENNKDGVGVDISVYNQSMKVNQCVVCGLNELGYMRHYIVPYHYRSKLPFHYKAHMPHDVVLVCPNCSIIAEQESLQRIKQLEYNARIHYFQERTMQQQQQQYQYQPQYDEEEFILSTKQELIDMQLQSIRSAALAMLRWQHKLPEQKKNEYTSLLQDYYYNNKDNNSVTNDGIHHAVEDNKGDDRNTNNTIKTIPEETQNITMVESMNGKQQQQQPQRDDTKLPIPPYLSSTFLQQCANINYRIPNPQYVAGVDLVTNELFQKLAESSSLSSTSPSSGITTTTEHPSPTPLYNVLDQFVIDCRKHFVMVMEPNYLPLGWDIYSPTYCDDDENHSRAKRAEKNAQNLKSKSEISRERERKGSEREKDKEIQQ